ncbi:hypothetical protein SAMN05660330_00680 [Desulforhopalus singaporensis]|uniref:Uncharacterized protein n=1 Tax=Desulforhopalus singaporensis TaxID=91360 RepID=A0A1H0L5Z5_9BACT|nr:hypothetical protein SAMN05660330_00680 [Desulforhopalus singaporensis]
MNKAQSVILNDNGPCLYDGRDRCRIMSRQNKLQPPQIFRLEAELA